MGQPVRSRNPAVPTLPTFRMPTAFRPIVTSRFGDPRSYPRWPGRQAHEGIDLAPPRGERTPYAVAAASGHVVRTGYDRSGYGRYVVIQHAGGYRTLYGHLDQIGVRVGQAVDVGQPIGVVGATGNATGRHLHFSVQGPGGASGFVLSNVIDPLRVLSRSASQPGPSPMRKPQRQTGPTGRPPSTPPPTPTPTPRPGSPRSIRQQMQVLGIEPPRQTGPTGSTPTPLDIGATAEEIEWVAQHYGIELRTAGDVAMAREFGMLTQTPTHFPGQSQPVTGESGHGILYDLGMGIAEGLKSAGRSLREQLVGWSANLALLLIAVVLIVASIAAFLKETSPIEITLPIPGGG